MPNPQAAADKPPDYLACAAEALRKAEQQASNPRVAATWVQIADRWVQLANTQK